MSTNTTYTQLLNLLGQYIKEDVGYKLDINDHKEVLETLVKSIVPLTNYSTGRLYKQGDTVVYNGAIYQANTDGITGSFIPANWTLIGNSNDVLSNFDDYDNSAEYVVGDTVKYQFKLYECILDSTGNLPTNATYWVEVSASEGKIIEDYVADTYYAEGQIVLKDDYLFKLDSGSETYQSTDFETEFGEGKWIAINGNSRNIIHLGSFTYYMDDDFDPTKDGTIKQGLNTANGAFETWRKISGTWNIIKSI